MPHYKAALVRQDGADLILVPLDPSFGLKSKASQDAVVAELQVQARSEGMAGTVVPVWSSGGTHMAFIAPPHWHSFLKTIALPWVNARATHQLYW